MADESAAWTLYGIQPPDNTFRDSPEEVHRAFWRYIAQAGVARFRWRCNAGLDRHGAGLAGIAESTFRRGRWRSHTGRGNALNPPLSPALGRSRTEELIRGRGFIDHAEWYWLVDPVTGLHWGQMMLWHREGSGHLPVRDVIGWSRDDIAELRHLGQEWWYHFQHGVLLKAAVEKLNLPHPKTGAIPPPKFEVTGDTDLSKYTFGIEGTKERTERAIAEGYHSGFSRKTPGGKAYNQTPPPPPPKPVPAPPKFGPSTAKVSVENRAEVRSRLRAIVGREMDERDAASVVGATHDTQVNVRPSTMSDKVIVSVRGPRYESTRFIEERDRVKTIHNVFSKIPVEHRGHGLGREVFGRQVEQSVEKGFEQIVTKAARDDDYNGYYTWPRFGFDGPLPEAVRASLPPEWRGAANISDLMVDDQRRQWWLTNGISLNLTFDLREGSLSRKAWQAYLLEKAQG
jgi:hypothetical protein